VEEGDVGEGGRAADKVRPAAVRLGGGQHRSEPLPVRRRGVVDACLFGRQVLGELEEHVDTRLVRRVAAVDARLPREVPHDGAALADEQRPIAKHRQLAEWRVRLVHARAEVVHAVVRDARQLEDEPRQLAEAAERKVLERYIGQVVEWRLAYDGGRPLSRERLGRRRRGVRGLSR